MYVIYGTIAYAVFAIDGCRWAGGLAFRSNSPNGMGVDTETLHQQERIVKKGK